VEDEPELTEEERQQRLVSLLMSLITLSNVRPSINVHCSNFSTVIRGGLVEPVVTGKLGLKSFKTET
jgi:hypothetical protein